MTNSTRPVALYASLRGKETGQYEFDTLREAQEVFNWRYAYGLADAATVTDFDGNVIVWLGDYR